MTMRQKNATILEKTYNNTTSGYPGFAISSSGGVLVVLLLLCALISFVSGKFACGPGEGEFDLSLLDLLEWPRVFQTTVSDQICNRNANSPYRFIFSSLQHNRRDVMLPWH